MFSLLVALATSVILPVEVKAHMAMWDPSMYGFEQSYEPVTPLANKGFDQWWFHGYRGSKPNQVKSIPAGGNVNVEIACSKSYTSWGNSPSGDACPGDSGAFHAGGSSGSGSGWNGNSDSSLTGCALAIAYKSNPWDVRPEDFTVFSIQENCVRQRDTSFAVPNNLPNCPDGECTCAWFWQGRNSAAEMYMTAFRCKVDGGVSGGSIPKPQKPKRRGDLSGPTQPMYWANDNSNLDYNPGWDDRPFYDSSFGWKGGAQTSAFNNLGGGGNGNSGNSPSSSKTTTTTISSRTRSRSSTQTPTTTTTTTNTGRPGEQYLAEPSATTSSTTQAKATTTTGSQGGGHGHCKRWVRRSRAHH